MQHHLISDNSMQMVAMLDKEVRQVWGLVRRMDVEHTWQLRNGDAFRGLRSCATFSLLPGSFLRGNRDYVQAIDRYLVVSREIQRS
jgi:hypothetical protein